MPDPGELTHRVVTAVERRTDQVVEALDQLDEEGLHASSQLPDWSRLTIACHLRYGARALRRMTSSARTGEAVSYYPDGRDGQRAMTLVPAPGELPHAVAASLRDASAALNRAWNTLEPEDWLSPVVEPEDNPDLGTVELGRLPLLRLTEVEVHGTDLGLGLDDWSDLFVRGGPTDAGRLARTPPVEPPGIPWGIPRFLAACRHRRARLPDHCSWAGGGGRPGH